MNPKLSNIEAVYENWRAIATNPNDSRSNQQTSLNSQITRGSTEAKQRAISPSCG